MLISAGLELPRQVFGHGWVTLKGERMSKSLGTAVDPLEAADHLGPDPLRLYLVKEVPYGGDGDFSWERFEEKYNVDLANNLGNLVNRVTTMAERYRQGTLRPTPLGAGRLAAAAGETVGAYRQAMERFALHEGVAAAYRLIDATNEFIAESEPWAIARTDPDGDRLGQVLFDVGEALRVAAVLLLPVMPTSCAEILSRAGETVAPRELRLERDATWKSDLARRLTRAGAMWPRLEPRAGAAEAAPSVSLSSTENAVSESSQPPTPVPPPAPAPPAPVGSAAPAPAGAERLSIDDFMKLELRVAKVLAAERVPKSKKLLKLQVDLGTEQRQLVAGIAEAYEPEALVGRSVVIVANLKPAVLMGIESNGMVLAASPDGGKPELVSFETAPPAGSRVR
jgi:methionyl-tRNA synthetase